MNVYWILLRTNKNFRLLWLSTVISNFGDWFNLIAAASLIDSLTDTKTAVSYLFLARFLPLFFFTPFAGVLADKYDRRRILIMADLLRAATVMGFLLIRSPQHIWLFYVLTISQFALSALFTPARTAVIASIVPPEEFVTANALDSLTWSVMFSVGSLLGAIATATLGASVAFVLDAVTYLISAWCVLPIVMPPHPTEHATDTPGMMAFVAGLRYLKGEPFILLVASLKGLGSLIWGAINVLEVNYAHDLYPLKAVWLPATIDGGAATLGLLYAMSGFGTGFGPIWLRSWFGDSSPRLRQTILVGFIFMGAGIGLISQAPSLSWLLFGTLLRTIGTGGVWVASAVLLQRLVPDGYRGRVFAFEFAFLTLTQSISIYWAGFAQDKLAFSPLAVTAIMAGLSLPVIVGWALYHRYRLSQESSYNATL